MLEKFANHWWVIAVSGVLAIVFGILALVWPQVTLLALVYVFAAFVVADGLVTLYFSIATRKEDERWGMLAASGIVEIVLGVLIFIWPQITAQVFVFLVAAWAIITGVFEIMAATELRNVIENAWLLILTGLLSLAFGVLLVIYPGAGAISLVWIIGFYAILNGILEIVFAFRLHDMANKVQKTLGTRTA